MTDIITAISKIAKGITDNLPAEEVLDSINKEKILDKNIIAAAYSWVYEKIVRDTNSLKVKNEYPGSSFRVLSETEKNLIGFNNYNYLLRFYSSGILNNIEMEKIIDQIKILPEESINLENINILILCMFLNNGNESLPGSRFMLYSSDTIN